MGFADYRRRNPTGEAIPPSDEDKSFVITSIEEINSLLLCNALSPNGAISSANQIADTKQVIKDVFNSTQLNIKANNAFCLNTFQNQPYNYTQSICSNYISSEIPIPTYDKKYSCYYNKKKFIERYIPNSHD